MYTTQQHIDRINYLNDSRTQAKDGTKPPTVILDDDSEVELPTTWGVCDLCHGEGKHVNPSIDAGGLTREDFADNPDFYDDYMSGTYDVTCNRCKGRTTIRVIDENAADPKHLELYYEQLEDQRQFDAEQRAELMMGA